MLAEITRPINQIIQGDCLEVIKTLPDNSIDAIVTDPPYGLSFMGKKWDYDVPSVEIWQECLRILKPGGYLLSFAGTRTQHRIACRIEDAGFEIRDMIAWVYGSGFPKSLNIGKTKTVDLDITKGTSEWEGWGTALKPALEPITVARKPLSEKTVAENCLKWGTGGINIDACRVKFGNETDSRVGKKDSQKGASGNPFSTGDNDGSISTYKEGGRFPANLIHDGSDEVVSLFPNTKSTANIRHSKTKRGLNGIYNEYEAQDSFGFNDSGSAARFFYCAKASKSERNKGCEELEEKERPATDFNMDTSDTKVAHKHKPQRNNHPTVKPIALMEYLVKLVSRESALVLDPFAGSGSTGLACKNTNRNYILIEKEPEYCGIIKKRLQEAKAGQMAMFKN